MYLDKKAVSMEQDVKDATAALKGMLGIGATGSAVGAGAAATTTRSINNNNSDSATCASKTITNPLKAQRQEQQQPQQSKPATAQNAPRRSQQHQQQLLTDSSPLPSDTIGGAATDANLNPTKISRNRKKNGKKKKGSAGSVAHVNNINSNSNDMRLATSSVSRDKDQNGEVGDHLYGTSSSSANINSNNEALTATAVPTTAKANISKKSKQRPAYNKNKKKEPENYAWSAFQSSPDASKLPLPEFTSPGTSQMERKTIFDGTVHEDDEDAQTNHSEHYPAAGQSLFVASKDNAVDPSEIGAATVDDEPLQSGARPENDGDSHSPTQISETNQTTTAISPNVVMDHATIEQQQIERSIADSKFSLLPPAQHHDVAAERANNQREEDKETAAQADTPLRRTGINLAVLAAKPPPSAAEVSPSHPASPAMATHGSLVVSSTSATAATATTTSSSSLSSSYTLPSRLGMMYANMPPQMVPPSYAPHFMSQQQPPTHPHAPHHHPAYPPPGYVTIQVQVPPVLMPGRQMVVSSPAGYPVHVVVPSGIPPNMIIPVHVPAGPPPMHHHHPMMVPPYGATGGGGVQYYNPPSYMHLHAHSYQQSHPSHQQQHSHHPLSSQQQQEVAHQQQRQSSQLPSHEVQQQQQQSPPNL